MRPLPYATDQLIDAAMARSLHADACRDHALVAWVVLWDLPAYPERFAAQAATSRSARGGRALVCRAVSEVGLERFPHRAELLWPIFREQLHQPGIASRSGQANIIALAGERHVHPPLHQHAGA